MKSNFSLNLTYKFHALLIHGSNRGPGSNFSLENLICHLGVNFAPENHATEDVSRSWRRNFWQFKSYTTANQRKNSVRVKSGYESLNLTTE